MALDASFWDVLAVKRDGRSGSITAQTGSVDTSTVDSHDTEWWQHVGFASMPAESDPAKKEAAQCIRLQGIAGSGTGVAIASKDHRSQLIYGQLKPGESAVFATKGMARALFKANGSVTLYTTDTNDDDGNSILVSVGTDGVKVATPWGAATITSDGVQLGEKDGAFIKLAGNKITLSASEIAIAGGTVVLGMVATPASPALWGLSGLSGAPSTSVWISP